MLDASPGSLEESLRPAAGKHVAIPGRVPGGLDVYRGRGMCGAWLHLFLSGWHNGGGLSPHTGLDPSSDPS